MTQPNFCRVLVSVVSIAAICISTTIAAGVYQEKEKNITLGEFPKDKTAARGIVNAGEVNESTGLASGVSTNEDTVNGWPVFRGNQRSTGATASKLPEKLEILWKMKVKNGGFEGTPVIVKNKIDKKKTVYIGDMDGMVFSIDLETGKKNWQKKTGIGIAASPAYRNGRIFIGDIDGFFWCFDEKGKLQWKFETMAEISGSANFYKKGVLFGSQDAKLYLLDQKTGRKIWASETPDQIQSSITVANEKAFVAGCDGFLHLIGLKEGKEVGKVNIQSPTRSTPAVLNEAAFFGTEQAAFLGVDLKAVGVRWEFADDDGQSAVRGCAAVSKGHVVFGARNRQVYSVNPESGKRQWSTTLKAKIDASPVIVGDRVFVGSTDGRLYALSLKDGKKLWEKQFSGSFLSSPAVAFDRIVVATERGVVYCLGKR